MNNRVSPHDIRKQLTDVEAIIKGIMSSGRSSEILHLLVNASPNARKEIAFVITSLLDKITKDAQNIKEVANLVALTVDLTRYPLCELVQMLKNRDGTADCQMLSQDKCLGSLMHYVYQLIKHFQLFEYEYTLKDQVDLLTVLTKHDKNITQNDRNVEMYIQLLNYHYAECRDGINLGISSLNQMSNQQFDKFYKAYEGVMTLNKKIEKSRWLNQTLLVVTRNTNQQIQFRHQKKHKDKVRSPLKNPKYSINFSKVHQTLAHSNFQERLKSAVDRINQKNT